MPEELPKTYNPSESEKDIYKFWETNRFFSPSGKGAVFSIVIPPPNITGNLHMGHALNNSIQDILIRYHRMMGDNTLWLPGTDHAGIATQNVVERDLKKEGKSKDDLGREKFIEKVWKWKATYGGNIIRQLKRLGASCDWSRERFTMDEGLSRAVRREFVSLYNKGLIYRGKRIINWCPRCKTALSDIETEYQNQKGKLWNIKYPVASSQGPVARGKEYVIVATTRPETMLGDTAVAVNPNDDRYKSLVGGKLILPIVGREIPIIADEFVDSSFGTGAVKVTPAHDPNDFEMAERHNLPKINILHENGHINFAGKYDGLDRFKAREAIVADLEAIGALEKIEDYENSVGHCYRCKTAIEPYLSDQWFVKMKPLAEPAIKAVLDGKIKFVPERWTKVYIDWMTKIKDWCISRQLWWGHQIPVWYCHTEIQNPKTKIQMNLQNQNPKPEFCNEIIVAEEKPSKCPKCEGAELEQDPDVFDTWFSSGLWPFSTLGWPDSAEASSGKPVNNSDLDIFYPTAVLVTSYDIIFFWVARMIMMGIEFMKKEPFHTVYLHALVKDIHGKKMSKSVGNVIDPVEVIDHAGADALRFALVSQITGQGQDIKMSEDKITEARNFANKLWNVSRFVFMNLKEIKPVGQVQLKLEDKWILAEMENLKETVAAHLNSYEFGEAAREIYGFVWGEFCDWYVEMAKIRLQGNDKDASIAAQSVLFYCLDNILRLLHPFMPFVTETIWQKLKEFGKFTDPALMVSHWPKPEPKLKDEKIVLEMDKFKEIARAVRNIRAELGVAHSAKIEVFIKGKSDVISHTMDLLGFIVGAERIELAPDDYEKPKHSAMAVVAGLEIYVPLEGLIDLAKEKERLIQQKHKIAAELEKVNAKLNDKKFMEHAPEEKVQENKDNAKALAEKLRVIGERVGAL